MICSVDQKQRRLLKVYLKKQNGWKKKIQYNLIRLTLIVKALITRQDNISSSKNIPLNGV
jgi:hypothetical protein